MTQRRNFIKLSLAFALAGAALAGQAQPAQTLLNVSYDRRVNCMWRSTPPSPNTGKPRPART